MAIMPHHGFPRPRRDQRHPGARPPQGQLLRPDVNPAYQELVEHYGVGGIPACAGKPRDQVKAEAVVQNVERCVLVHLWDMGQAVLLFRRAQRGHGQEAYRIERPGYEGGGKSRRELFDCSQVRHDLICISSHGSAHAEDGRTYGMGCPAPGARHQAAQEVPAYGEGSVRAALGGGAKKAATTP